MITNNIKNKLWFVAKIWEPGELPSIEMLKWSDLDSLLGSHSWVDDIKGVYVSKQEASLYP